MSKRSLETEDTEFNKHIQSHIYIKQKEGEEIKIHLILSDLGLIK